MRWVNGGLEGVFLGLGYVGFVQIGGVICTISRVGSPPIWAEIGGLYN